MEHSGIAAETGSRSHRRPAVGRLGSHRRPRASRSSHDSVERQEIPGDTDRAELLLLAFDDTTARTNVTAGLLADGERKDQFIAMLGHELRHPLTPITHAIYLLKQRHLDPTEAELLHVVDTETQRLLRFVNELLDVERVGRGLMEIRQERLDFVALVHAAADASRPFLEERRHALSLVLPAAPIYVDGDSGRLSQVITNLVENAAKYTEPGGQITVTVEQRDDEVVLRVRDSGIGIAAEDLERVFEPFTKSRHASPTPAADWDWDSPWCGECWSCIVAVSGPPAAVSGWGASLSSRCLRRRRTAGTIRGPRARWNRRFRSLVDARGKCSSSTITRRSETRSRV